MSRRVPGGAAGNAIPRSSPGVHLQGHYGCTTTPASITTSPRSLAQPRRGAHMRNIVPIAPSARSRLVRQGLPAPTPPCLRPARHRPQARAPPALPERCCQPAPGLPPGLTGPAGPQAPGYPGFTPISRSPGPGPRDPRAPPTTGPASTVLAPPAHRTYRTRARRPGAVHGARPPAPRRSTPVVFVRPARPAPPAPGVLGGRRTTNMADRPRFSSGGSDTAARRHRPALRPAPSPHQLTDLTASTDNVGVAIRHLPAKHPPPASPVPPRTCPLRQRPPTRHRQGQDAAGSVSAASSACQSPPAPPPLPQHSIWGLAFRTQSKKPARPSRRQPLLLRHQPDVSAWRHRHEALDPPGVTSPDPSPAGLVRRDTPHTTPRGEAHHPRSGRNEIIFTTYRDQPRRPGLVRLPDAQRRLPRGAAQCIGSSPP
jgi:hypothetical protein